MTGITNWLFLPRVALSKVDLFSQMDCVGHSPFPNGLFGHQRAAHLESWGKDLAPPCWDPRLQVLWTVQGSICETMTLPLGTSGKPQPLLLRPPGCRGSSSAWELKLKQRWEAVFHYSALEDSLPTLCTFQECSNSAVEIPDYL